MSCWLKNDKRTRKDFPKSEDSNSNPQSSASPPETLHTVPSLVGKEND